MPLNVSILVRERRWQTMSKERRVLELVPPSCQITHETVICHGHECGYCHGNGYFWGRDANWESVKVPCPICQGKKEMKAIIEITWLPDNEKTTKK